MFLLVIKKYLIISVKNNGKIQTDISYIDLNWDQKIMGHFQALRSDLNARSLSRVLCINARLEYSMCGGVLF